MLSNTMPNSFAFAFWLSPRFEAPRDYGAIGDSPSIGGRYVQHTFTNAAEDDGNINQLSSPMYELT
jgi:hypothetical protein